VFRRVLQDALKARVHDAKLQVPEYVLAVEIVSKQSVFGFYGNVMSPFLRIFVALPKHVPASRSLLESGLNVPPFGLREYQTFESSNPYALRFMIDTGLRGAAWVELPEGKYTVRSPSAHDSSMQIEVDVAYDALIAHEPEGEWSRLAPLRTLSFDIECAARKGCFPEADKDPVIQIANLVSVHGQTDPIVKNVFVLGSCTPIVGAHVLTFDSERELLEAWRQFFSEIDPDVVIGYNTANFDIPYLMDRAATLGVHSFPFLGRLPTTKSLVRSATFSSKAYGTRESKTTDMEGRVQLDIMQVLQRDHKLSAYSLNAVSAHFLGEQKEDVHHSIIADLHNGSPEDRRRLAVYCVKDAYLPLRLMEKLMILYNYVEMARVTGVPLSYLLSRGQQIKVLSQLYRAANAENLIIPTFRSQGSNVKLRVELRERGGLCFCFCVFLGFWVLGFFFFLALFCFFVFGFLFFEIW
jgi:DNA polymerase delta subunit 1